MRATFGGWYQRTPEELARLWNNAIFVPDANILLHCLRHSSEVREELLRILELLRESLWYPYQVGLEFHRHRLEVEAAGLDAYDRLLKDYEVIFNQARDKLRQLRAHPSIDVERELSAIDMFFADFSARVEEARTRHPTDALGRAAERLTAIFEGRVGAKPTAERLAAIKKEGEDRYAKKIPPGYMDAKKDSPDGGKFGDLIIWRDLIDKAREAKKPLIFISDDVKEDWWRLHRGRKLGARPELLEEFKAATGEEFHIYELGQFLRIAAQNHGEIEPGKVERIEKSVSDEQDARKRMESQISDRALLSTMIALENERDVIISALAGLPTVDLTRMKESGDKTGMRVRLVEIERELVEIKLRLEPAEGPSL